MTLLAGLLLSTVTLDPQLTQGKWEGWGTSLCWMGKMFGDRDDLADLFFTTKDVRVGDETLPGLGLNIVRYNAGACSWKEFDGRKMVVGRTIQPFRQMEGFWVDPNTWDWSLDANQRAMLLKAKQRGADRFELFSNSPMWWMCANDNPSGAADPMKDNLRPDQADAFAVYIAEVAKHAKEKWGVSFTTVDPFNEPASKWWDENCKQEGCHFDAATQADFLPRLRRELDRRGLRGLPISASDETYMTQAIQTWNHFGEETKALVSQVNVHGYEGLKSPRRELRAAVGDRRVWMSEHGENDANGMELAKSLALDLHNLKAVAWCYWQPLDGGGWGLLDADVPRARVRRSAPKYFVLAQFSRHIRTGMTILETGDVDTVAAYDGKKKRLVVVAINPRDTEETRSLNLSKFEKIGKARRWTTEAKGVARYREDEAKVERKLLNATLAPNSVQTFEVVASR